MKRVLSQEAIRLLRKVKRLALEEPKRMAMGRWLVKKHEWSWESTPRRGYPKCGTVGCIGGWVEELYSLEHPKARARKARRILGLTPAEDQTLFYDDDLCHAPDQQTVAHATAVAKHIDKFIRERR